MQFSLPLDEILHSRAAVRVLRALSLFPAKEFTGRQLAGEAGVPPSVAIAELNLLRDQGLVRRRTVGRSQLWQLASSHRVAGKLRELFDFEFALDQELRQTLSQSLRKMEGVERAILFGSVARHATRPTSDIDLLVIVDAPQRKKSIMDALGPVKASILRKFGNRLSPILYTVAEWRARRGRDLVSAIEREGRLVWERSS